jgi:hypothetical protein
MASQRIAKTAGHAIKGVVEQMNMLRQLFPSIRYPDKQLAEQPLLSDVGGIYVFPKWQALGRTYPDAVKTVFEKINDTQCFRVHFEEGKRLRSLYPCGSTERCMKLAESSPKAHDILALHAQFGLRHSAKRLLWLEESSYALREFGIGIFAASVMLLTHPEYVTLSDGLTFSFPGDTCSVARCFPWETNAPSLSFVGNNLIFGSDNKNFCRDSSRCVTGFI